MNERNEALAPERVAELAEALCPPHHRTGWASMTTDASGKTTSKSSPRVPCELHKAQAQQVAPLVAGWWLAEAEIAGQMKHITAEVARGDVSLSDSEELIAALRARISHAEAERDEAFRVAPNMGAAVYERGKRDGAAEVRARVAAVLDTEGLSRSRFHAIRALDRMLRAALAEPGDQSGEAK